MSALFECEVWWCRGNMFASHHYGLAFTLTLGHMWDVFHPSQIMPGSVPLGFSSTLMKGLKLFRLEPSQKADWPGQNLFWVM